MLASKKQKFKNFKEKKVEIKFFFLNKNSYLSGQKKKIEKYCNITHFEKFDQKFY